MIRSTVWIVILWDDGGTPCVTVFSDKEAADMCYRAWDSYKHVTLDEYPVWGKYLIGNETGMVETEEAPAMELYRPWQTLLKEPSDMTEIEKARLKRIKAIPQVARDAAWNRSEFLVTQIMALERERDELIDFLNGEVWGK